MEMKFVLNANRMLTTRPLLNKGTYKGKIVDVALKDPFNADLQSIRVTDEELWNKEIVNPKTGKEGMMVKTGNKVLTGTIIYSAELNDPGAEKQLGIDNPKIYGGRIALVFKKDGSYDEENNIAMNAAIKALRIDFESIFNGVVENFTADEDILVPEDEQDIPGIKELYNWCLFHNELFERIIMEMDSAECNFKITHSVSMGGETIHSLDCGFNKTRTSSTGRNNAIC